ncbi:MAG: SDR family NAD(P)-dependent oxidoreductase [Micromonosporaceae bacterium]
MNEPGTMAHSDQAGDLPGSSAPLSAPQPGPRLARRRVLVVGGGSHSDPGDAPPNNGYAICAVAAAEGAAVAVGDIDPSAAERTVGHLRRAGGSAEAIAADVADPGQCDDLVDGAIARLGGIDGVVLNVGIGEGLGLDGTSAAIWDRVFAINVRAHFLIAKRALPRMQRGAIVFVGSLAGSRPGTFSPSYDASKSAISALSRHVALEGASRGIRANVVAPGLIDTPMGRDASKSNPVRDRIPVPLGRQGTAWEVAQAVIFLLSDHASYITGHELIVDGGLANLIRPP